jgi:hypothetical protein
MRTATAAASAVTAADRRAVRVRTALVWSVAALAFAGCGGDDEPAAPASPADPGVIHVHGLGRNPADGALMVATHTGLFRVRPGAAVAQRVADNYQDTMGFTVVGPDHFLGSGHPGSTDDPPFLGLIESRNAGEKWRPISLRGEVDFHVLEAQGRTVYGFGSDFDTREPRFLRSGDGGRSWERLAPPEPLLALAIDPEDPMRIVALGEERGHTSRDGGKTWRPLPLPGGFVTWTRDAGAVAIDLAGTVRKAEDPEDDWQEAGQVGAPPAAFDASGNELLVATHEPRVLSSTDGGQSWTDLLDS